MLPFLKTFFGGFMILSEFIFAILVIPLFFVGIAFLQWRFGHTKEYRQKKGFASHLFENWLP